MIDTEPAPVITDAPTETLIAALERISRGFLPENQDNLFRALYHKYAELTEIKQRNFFGSIVFRAYPVSLTDSGRALLEESHGHNRG